MLSSSKLLITLSAVLTGTVRSWGINGHFIVANIAQNLLLDQAPDTYTQAMTMLQILKDSNAACCVSENQHPFVECATFADDIKYQAGGGGSW